VTRVFVRRGGAQTNGSPVVLQAGANLQTGERKFDRLFSGITTLEADLLLIAASIFAIDRCVERRPREDLVRGLEVSIPVVNIARLQPLQSAIEDLLRSLSNDAWRLTFRQEGGSPEENVAVDPSNGTTLLFSGGLDSLAAAIELGTQGTPLQLVSHNTRNPQTAGVQNGLGSMLGSLGIRPPHRKFQVTAFPRPPGPGLSFEAESSQRTRSFLFLTLAVLCARRVGHQDVVYIAENGQMAIHLPLTQARIGAFSTHTAHPEVLTKAEHFFSQALALTIHIRNPYVHRTKAEVTKIVWDRLPRSIPTTISCWKTSRLTGDATHCGVCIPCIIRRIAIEFHGEDTTAYERDLFVESFADLPEDDDGRRNLADFGEFVVRVERYSAMEMMTEFPDLYCPQIVSSAAIEMYKRAASEARTVLARYPNIAPVLR
jgi:7-cyano-7-deazaguanine synthase in queuosine biosynthesis